MASRVGRLGEGGTLPFQLFGAPTLDALGLAQRLNSLDLGPVRFRPAYFTPALSKHAGRPCAGVQVHALEPLERALPLGLAVVGALAEQSIELNPDWLQKLLGIPFDPELFVPERGARALLGLGRGSSSLPGKALACLALSSRVSYKVGFL